MKTFALTLLLLTSLNLDPATAAAADKEVFVCQGPTTEEGPAFNGGVTIHRNHIGLVMQVAENYLSGHGTCVADSPNQLRCVGFWAGWGMGQDNGEDLLIRVNRFENRVELNRSKLYGGTTATIVCQ